MHTPRLDDGLGLSLAIYNQPARKLHLLSLCCTTCIVHASSLQDTSRTCKLAEVCRLPPAGCSWRQLGLSEAVCTTSWTSHTGRERHYISSSHLGVIRMPAQCPPQNFSNDQSPSAWLPCRHSCQLRRSQRAGCSVPEARLLAIARSHGCYLLSINHCDVTRNNRHLSQHRGSSIDALLCDQQLHWVHPEHWRRHLEHHG